MRLFFSCLFLISFFNVFSQEEKSEEKSLIKIDSLYREDQFYFSAGYNLLTQGPNGLKQDKFSAGLSLGFLRDMPVNKSRTVAIAAGLGFTYKNFYQNLVISTNDTGIITYKVSDYGSITSNRFRQYAVDLPIEFRWRNSTFESHKFFRIYTGIKLSYAFSNTSFLDNGTQSYKINNNSDVNKFQYGVYLSTGYNTWNLYVYYGLNPLLKSATTIQGEKIEMKATNIGLMFYIL